MHIWALCLVCMYVSLGVFNWVTGLHWLGEFSLPLSIVAGLGLAIASNSTPTSDATASTMSAASTPRPIPEDAAVPTESKKDIAPEPSTAPSSPGSTAAEPSISFTIHKDVRPQ